jgi:hypothetical protein
VAGMSPSTPISIGVVPRPMMLLNALPTISLQIQNAWLQAL